MNQFPSLPSHSDLHSRSRRGPSRWRSSLLGACLVAAGCAEESSPPATSPSAAPAASPEIPSRERGPAAFVDVTGSSGVDFVHQFGAEPQFFYPETMAGGGGFFDADQDGDQDLFLVNGSDFPPDSKGATHRLFLNQGNGRFRDATKESGLGIAHPGMACVAADIDNDGDQDLLVTGVHRTLLFQNRGDGTFVENGEPAGVDTGRWASAASFFDYDRDGVLDLIIGHYVKWSLEHEKNLSSKRFCEQDGQRDYCPVWAYKPDGLSLLRGRGDGTFEEMTEAAGMGGEGSKVLGIAVLDFDRDGWLDVYVANDKEPSQLFRNRQDGTFQDLGYEAGLALDRYGNSYAGMGVDVTYRGNGERLGISVGNFTGEPVTLHEQESAESLEFAERSRECGLGTPTLRQVTFGLLFFDYDLDDREDLFVANGHVEKEPGQQGVTYAQPCQLFRAVGDKFEEVETDGPAIPQQVVGRGAAFADIDGDGDLDLWIGENQGPTRILENRHAVGGFVRVTLQGKKSNRDGIGSLVTFRIGDQVRRDRLVTGTSYLSMNELALTQGLGDRSQIDEIEIQWPSGTRDVYEDVAAGTRLHAVEGETGSGTWTPEAAESLQPFANLDLAALRPRLKEDPENAPLHKLVGTRALDEGNLELAVTHLTEATRLAPQDSTAAVHLARALLAHGDVELARSAVEGWFDRFDFEVITMNMLLFLGKLGQDELAQIALSECIARQPDSAYLHFQEGNLHRARGRMKKALASFEATVAADPEYHAAYLAMSDCYTRLGELDKAETYAREALAHKPDSVPASRQLANALMAQKRPRDVLAMYTKLISEHGEDFDLRLDFAKLLLEIGKNRDAEFHLRKVTELHPQRRKGWVEYLKYLFEDGKKTKAVPAAIDAINECGVSPGVVIQAAQIHGVLGENPSLALRLLDQAVAARPEHAGAWRERARISMSTDNKEKAIESYLRLQELTPNDEEAARALDILRKDS